MSSRNVRLSLQEREQSANISKTLFNSIEFSKTHTVLETKEMVVAEINKFNTMNVEYFEIFNSETFETLQNWNSNAHACIAVNVGKTRLIDNVSYVF
jgi:pantoate--beta-alanine ligase